MKLWHVLALAGAAIVLCGVLFLRSGTPANDVAVVNHYGHSIAQVVIKGPQGIALKLNDIPDGAIVHGRAEFHGEGAVTYEVKAAGLERSGLLGFVKPQGNYSFTITIEKDGFVSFSASTLGMSFGFR